MRVFLTGATGLVGRHVLAALRSRGDGVLALARSDHAAAILAEAGADVLLGDVRDDAALRRGVEACDATVHAAGVILTRAGWARYHDVNVAPTAALARRCAAADRRLVHVSSVAVYGRRTTYDGGRGSVAEDFGLDRPIFPGDYYARSKREAELALWHTAEATGLRAVAVRPCVIYGEWDRAFTNRVARWMRAGFAPLIGAGDNPLAAVYAGNVAAAIVAALDRPAVTGAFNVANDGDLTQRGFLASFAEGLGVRLRFVRVPCRMAWSLAIAGDTLRRLGRPSAPMTLLKTAVQFLANPNPYVSARAERELGWHPVVAAEDAVRQTAAHIRRARAGS